MGARLRRHRRAPLKTIALAAALAVAAAAFGVLSADTHANGLSPKIGARVLSGTANGQDASFVVYLSDQADLSAAYRMKNQDARGWYVYRTLKAEAARTQAPIRAMLGSRGVSLPLVLGRERDRRRRATGRSSKTLAARPDVKAIEANDDSRTGSRTRTPQTRRAVARRHVEPGVSEVHAPDAVGARLHRAGHRHRRTRTPACAGRTTRSSRTTAAGTARPPTTTTTGTTRSTSGGGACAPNHTAALRRQRPRHPHDRHDVGRRRRRQPDRRRPGRQVDRLPEHGPGQRNARRPTPSASSSSSRRPT